MSRPSVSELKTAIDNASQFLADAINHLTLFKDDKVLGATRETLISELEKVNEKSAQLADLV